MHDLYENPLVSRYASKEMAENFSDDKKFKTWRKLWIVLAEAQRELGIDISSEQLEQMKAFRDEINYDYAIKKERELRHDVMAHVHAYGEQCPLAMPILHLGATSAFVGDNTDILVMLDGLNIIRKKLISCIALLSEFAFEYKDMPTLGFTHFQPAQLTTVGKRACLWIQDLVLDVEELEQVSNSIRLRGVKGTTGTQASFLALFNQDHDKVKQLENKIAKMLGFKKVFPVTGQTYSRKLDSRILNLLSSIAQSAGKFSSDLRLLQGLKELEEPFEDSQIGSSAMPYKRNPMRSERMASIARFTIINSLNPAMTASTQWLERTLDDSANRRIVIPQSFLAVDAILNIYMNVAKGLVVYPEVISKRVREELPFMATEHILMEMVKRGGDRQLLHERLRQHSMEATRLIKLKGEKNSLLDLIAGDTAFNISRTELEELLSPDKFVGRAPRQVVDFVEDHVKPLLKRYKHEITDNTELKV
jgi:adenylosuccinate lyase